MAGIQDCQGRRFGCVGVAKQPERPGEAGLDFGREGTGARHAEGLVEHRHRDIEQLRGGLGCAVFLDRCAGETLAEQQISHGTIVLYLLHLIGRCRGVLGNDGLQDKLGHRP